MRRATLSLAIGWTLAAVLASTVGVAGIQASKRLDRTYRCAVGVEGGIRSVNVSAQTGVRDLENRALWRIPPHVHLITETGSSSVRVRAGPAVSEPSAASWVETFFALGCARTSVSVPLSTSGLSGGRASQFGDRYQCPAPRTVVVRVRVEFVRRAAVGQRARVPVKAASLVVRTVSDKPLAYADVQESGRARLFAAPSCIPE